MNRAFSIKYSKVVFIILVLLFRVSLDSIYYLYIAPYFGYKGFLLEPSVIKTVISYAILIVTAGFLPISGAYPSVFIVGFMYLVSFVPITVLAAHGGFPVAPAVVLAVAFIFISYLSTIKLRLKLNPFHGYSGPYLAALAIIAYAVFFSILIIKFKLNLPESLNDVYDIRAEYKETVKYSSSVFAYMLIWLGNVIIPLIAAWALIKRRLTVFVIAVVSQLMVFAMAGFKSQLFAIFFILWIFAGIRYYRKKMLSYCAASFSVLVLMSFLLDVVTSDILMSSLFSRRLFFLPAQLYYYYFDFFSQNAHTYLSQSNALAWLIKYPYSLPVPNLIGDIYMESPTTSANANMWADAYTSFGLFGLFIFAVLLWLLNNIIDNLSSGKNIYLVFGLIAMPLFSLTNTAFLTTLLTHGMLLSVFFIMLLPKTGQMMTKRHIGKQAEPSS